MNIIQKIKNFVEEECMKPSSKYGFDPFTFHYIPTIKYAEELILELWWDREVILIASRLHDIWSIVYWRKDHHITGAKIAEEKLLELKYPINKIELIKKCILNHRWSINSKRESIEEQIVSEADTMSNFDNISWVFCAAFTYENLNQWEARKSVKNKLEKKWKNLHFEKSKEIIKPKYEAAMLLLK